MSTTASSSSTPIKTLRKQHLKYSSTFARFGLIMHIGNDRICLKTKVMFFPSTLNQAKQEATEETMPKDLYYTNGTRIHFTRHFKYLGSTITPELTEDVKINA